MRFLRQFVFIKGGKIMVTTQNGIQINADGVLVHPETYYGLRTDNKPEAANGSAFIEMDTGKIYFYDASDGGSGWTEWGA